MSSQSCYWRAGLLCLSVSTAFAAEPSPMLAHCAHIPDDGQRLACFDKAVVAPASIDVRNAPSKPAEAAAAQPAGSVAAYPEPGHPRPFRLAEYWETEPAKKRGVFAFRPHHANYLLFAKRTSHPNEGPFKPFRALDPEADDMSNNEMMFQLSFKTKIIEDISPRHADLWFGYTQQSFWQAYAHRDSSPFRETNYQPEAMLVVPTGFRLLGMTNEFVNVGIVHQSNGQPSTLSRSWNRLYVQTGMEQGEFTVLARAWKRLRESAKTDDNPDIEQYLGYGDLQATWRRNGYLVSMLARRNFRTRHGALQLGWGFPLNQHLKGFIQAFSGYGESLIDYNARQSTLGLGVTMDY